MPRIARSDSFETHEPATAADLARPEADAALVAKSGRTDAVSAGIVRNGGELSKHEGYLAGLGITVTRKHTRNGNLILLDPEGGRSGE